MVDFERIKKEYDKRFSDEFNRLVAYFYAKFKNWRIAESKARQLAKRRTETWLSETYGISLERLELELAGIGVDLEDLAV